MAGMDSADSPPAGGRARRRGAGADGSDRRFVSGPAAVLTTLFVAFHISVLLVYNLPARGLTRGIFKIYDRTFQIRRYVATTGIEQNWGLFAPTPPKANEMVRVTVIDADGRPQEFGPDYARMEPPWFYSRLRKINKSLFGSAASRKEYAAWVCRQWELDHHGDPAREVWLVRQNSVVPPPSLLAQRFGYDPRSVPIRTSSTETMDCLTEPHAQLPPRLRVRRGLPDAGEHHFKEIRTFTWVDRREREAAAAP